MEKISAREALRRQVFAMMPPPPWYCIICGSPSDFAGAGRIDGVMTAYTLCTACLGPGYVDRVIATIRLEILRQRQN